jgi:hypothetical protein
MEQTNTDLFMKPDRCGLRKGVMLPVIPDDQIKSVIDFVFGVETSEAKTNGTFCITFAAVHSS